MKVSFGAATFDVSFTDDYPTDDEFLGTGGWFDVNRKQYAALYDEYRWEQYSADRDVLEWDAEEHDERDSVTIPDSDDFIVFANAAGIEGGLYEITFAGNPYWFFHDLSHAEHDCSAGSVSIDPYGMAEERALYDGAVMARDHDVKLVDIIRQLASVEPLYRERFNKETEALNRFLELLDKRNKASDLLLKMGSAEIERLQQFV